MILCHMPRGRVCRVKRSRIFVGNDNESILDDDPSPLPLDTEYGGGRRQMADGISIAIIFSMVRHYLIVDDDDDDDDDDDNV